jgi:hypothetical protein
VQPRIGAALVPKETAEALDQAPQGVEIELVLATKVMDDLGVGTPVFGCRPLWTSWTNSTVPAFCLTLVTRTNMTLQE